MRGGGGGMRYPGHMMYPYNGYPGGYYGNHPSNNYQGGGGGGGGGYGSGIMAGGHGNYHHGNGYSVDPYNNFNMGAFVLVVVAVVGGFQV